MLRVSSFALLVCAASCARQGPSQPFKYSDLQQDRKPRPKSADTTSPTAGSIWDASLRGANSFNAEENDERFAAASAAGIKLLRLSPTKWKGSQRDFLIGNADDYRGLVGKDLAKLRAALDGAARHGLKIVLTTMTLPGARWRQHNNDKPDLRLWREQRHRDMALQFWTDLAAQLRSHPALIGYEPLNEPCPEVADGLHDWWQVDYATWQPKRRGTLQDINRFNREMVAAIRRSDSNIPVVISSGLYGSPAAFAALEPLSDRNVIYTFHMYEPWIFTSGQNRGRFTYPGAIPNDPETPGPSKRWDRAAQESFLAPVRAFQTKYGVPASRVWAGEFGCFRLNKGCADYMMDLIGQFETAGWHWSYWAFREDDWHGWDYELGTEPMKQAYWDAVERGEPPPLERKDNPLFGIIKKALAKANSSGNFDSRRSTHQK